jgi:hypothetical protein
MVSSCPLRLTILLSRLGPWFERREPGNAHGRTQAPFESTRFPELGLLRATFHLSLLVSYHADFAQRETVAVR